MARKYKNPLVTVINPKSPAAESYRGLRTNIQFSVHDKQVRVIMVGSAQMNEGKTTTVSNLAVAYAHEGKNVLLIEADLRKSSLHHVFGVSNDTGLTNVLAQQVDVEDVIRPTAVTNLSVITSGSIPYNPSEMLGSHNMQMLVHDLKQRYDMILFDTPPILAVSDALIVSALCDGVVLVVLGGKVKKSQVRKAKTQLEHVKAHLLGVVLNNITIRENEAEQLYYGSKWLK